MYNFQTSRVGVKKYFINPRRAAIPPKGRTRGILGQVTVLHREMWKVTLEEVRGICHHIGGGRAFQVEGTVGAVVQVAWCLHVKLAAFARFWANE